MDTSSKACYFLSLTLFFLSCSAQNSSHPNTNLVPKNILVYKKCENNSFIDSTNSVQQILSTLFQELVGQSSNSKFFETSAGDNVIAISGLFQCRKDLTQNHCQNCVKQIYTMSKKLCGNRIPGRIHLSGCYLQYKPDGYENSRLEIQHKRCGGLKGDWGGFGEMREKAFEGLEDCVVNGHGYCDFKYETIQVMGQCEGNLGRCECGECLNSAGQIVKDECGYSVSGEVYLDGCFVSYSYYEDGNSGYSDTDHHGSGNRGKLVAIVIGGIAALSFGFIFLLCLTSLRTKEDD